MTIQRYMFIKCAVCHYFYISAEHCHCCGAMTLEDSNGNRKVGRIKHDMTFLPMARAKVGLYDQIMRTAKRIGFRA